MVVVFLDEVGEGRGAVREGAEGAAPLQVIVVVAEDPEAVTSTGAVETFEVDLPVVAFVGEVAAALLHHHSFLSAHQGNQQRNKRG